MDGLSIASSIIAFVDAGLLIKNSIEKVAKNRKRILLLCEDIVRDLNTFRAFCEVHKVDLRTTIELRDSLEQLIGQLKYVHSQCRGLSNVGARGRLNKLRTTFRSWRNADDIEERIVHLKETVQSCLMRLHLYVSMRSEMAIARMSHNVLVVKSDLQYHVNRFDDLFGQRIYQGGSDGFSPFFDYVDPDALDQQYLRIKLQSMLRTLESLEFSVASVNSLNWSIMTYVGSFTPLTTPTVITSIMQVWTVLRTLQTQFATSSIFDFLDPILDLAYDLKDHGLDHIRYLIIDFGARVLRQAIQVSNDDGLLLLLSWVLSQQYRICPNGYDEITFTWEIVDLRRNLLRSNGETYSKVDRCVWLHQALSALAHSYHHNEQFDEELSCFQELFELVHSIDYIDFDEYNPITCEISGEHTDVFSLSQKFEHDFTVAQATAYTLCTYADSLQLLGRYSEAWCAGRDSIAIIQALNAHADYLPLDFDFLDDNLAWIQNNLPLWVEIGRSPSFVEEITS